MSLLETRDLNAFYGYFQALFDVSIRLEEGQSIALIGPNGAGKTTLLRSIAGWVNVENDTVWFDGQPIGGRPANSVVSLGIGSVPEGRRLFASLTVEENLLIGRESGREGVWTQDKVLEVFPALRERLHHLGSNLSGGQQQMVAIGRALMSSPTLILFDELSLGLAPSVVDDIYRKVRQIHELGVTAIVIEQDMKRALRVASHVFVMLEGHVVLEARPEDVTEEQVSAAYFGTEIEGFG